jgi:hypothetical protein
MVRKRQRLAAGLSIVLATALVTAALAQPRRKPPKPPKPVAVVDGGDNPYSGDDTAAAAGGPAPASPSPGGVFDAGAPTGAVPKPEAGDGGVKPSPLNPAPNEMPGAGGTPPAPSAPAAVDYDKLLGDIAALRARVAAVADNLFVSRIGIAIETDGDHAKIARLVVSLDDGVVYTAPPNFHADDPATVYDHAVAPGRHAVTVDIDRRDDREETYRSSQRSRFTVEVPKDQRLTVTLRVGDDSGMGADFPGDRSGKYDLRVRMKAVAAPVTRP